MRLLLINPPFALPKHMVNNPNTGLAYLAAYLFQQGHELSYLEMNLIREGDWQERLKRAVMASEPQAVGFSIMLDQTWPTIQLCRLLRQFYQGPIILGGPNASCLGETLLARHPEIDILVTSEGEVTTDHLLKSLGGDLAQVEGLIYRQNGRIMHTPTRPLLPDLDALPWPFYDLFGFETITRYPLLTSRGCPFDCIFCYKVFGKKVRFRNVADCVAELAWAKEHFRASQFRIIDDTFNLQPERVEEFCHLVLEQKLDLPWECFGFRADRVTAKMARLIKQAGCFSANLGFESLDPDVFPQVNKGETLEDLMRGATYLREAGIHITGYIIIGLPGDTLSRSLNSFHKAWTLAERLGISMATPLPGTALHAWVEKESRLKVDLEEAQPKGDLTKVSFDTPEFPEEERLLAYQIMSSLSQRPISASGGPRAIRLLKHAGQLLRLLLHWNFLILRHDSRNYFKHWGYIWKRIRAKLTFRHFIHYDRYQWRRVPDGTWSLTKNQGE